MGMKRGGKGKGWRARVEGPIPPSGSPIKFHKQCPGVIIMHTKGDRKFCRLNKSTKDNRLSIIQDKTKMSVGHSELHLSYVGLYI